MICPHKKTNGARGQRQILSWHGLRSGRSLTYDNRPRTGYFSTITCILGRSVLLLLAPLASGAAVRESASVHTTQYCLTRDGTVSVRHVPTTTTTLKEGRTQTVTSIITPTVTVTPTRSTMTETIMVTSTNTATATAAQPTVRQIKQNACHCRSRICRILPQ